MRPTTLVQLASKLYGLSAGFGLPVAGAALSRSAAALVHDDAAARRHRRHDGSVRSRAGAGADRAPSGHARAMGADAFRALAEAGARGARSLRRLVAAQCDSRCRAVPGPGQAADDRLVGADPVRVLRRHRGQRHDGDQRRRMAAQEGIGRSRGVRRAAHLRRRRRASSPPMREGTVYFAGGKPFEYHNAPAENRGVATIAMAGARSATSATSTRTAICSSPTARRS